jgi:hypothetical protein
MVASSCNPLDFFFPVTPVDHGDRCPCRNCDVAASLHHWHATWEARVYLAGTFVVPRTILFNIHINPRQGDAFVVVGSALQASAYSMPHIIIARILCVCHPP